MRHKEIIKYRLFLWRSTSNNNKIFISIVTEKEQCNSSREKWEGFIRWVGDWQEVEA